MKAVITGVSIGMILMALVGSEMQNGGSGSFHDAREKICRGAQSMEKES